nr:peroxidase 64 [Ipomoea batatas]
MGGIDGPKTMKFRGQIAGLDILIMVDSGASHNFISRQLTAVLQHPLEPTTTFGVRLGDGRRAESDGKYSQLHVDLGPIAMPIDCFVFPLGGVDLILGIAWLETLGDVKANWAKLTMEFTIGDIPVQLVGDPSLARLPISLSSLDKIEDTAYCWLLWELSLSPIIQAASEISAVQKSQLTERLQQHQHIFGEPKGLPPFRANDHRITLQTGQTLAKSTYEKELMALVLAIQHWRPYLVGRRFTVRTDHRSLRHLLQQRITTPSQQNWVAKLMGYDFEIPRLLEEFHSTPVGGHSRAYRTYRRLAASIYWKGMMKHTQQFVAECLVCQKNKYDTLAPAGLLQPLPIPTAVWEDIAMDFISGLPRSYGFDCIWVVIDRFTKYAHFIGLKHPFTAKSLAGIFAKEIVRLHGVPRSIYLRCMTSEQPKQWGRFLHWAEYWYNTSFQSAAGITPFQVVYGRVPPTLKQYLPGEFKVEAVAEEHNDRNEMLRQLRYHLENAQNKMAKAANTKRHELQFSKGDKVLLKLRPHRQSTIYHRINQKLAPRFYGPFTILQKYSAVSYKLALPDTAKVHPIFHVSQLRRVTGNHTAVTDLPKDMAVTEPGFDPQDILNARQQNGVHQVLVKWEGRPEEEATWIDVEFKVEAVAEEHADKNEMLIRYNLEKAQNRMTKVANVKRHELEFTEGDKSFIETFATPAIHNPPSHQPKVGSSLRQSFIGDSIRLEGEYESSGDVNAKLDNINGGNDKANSNIPVHSSILDLLVGGQIRKRGAQDIDGPYEERMCIDTERRNRACGWNLLKTLSSQNNLPWVVVRDFNDILSSSEKRGGNPQLNWLLQGFRKAVNSSSLSGFAFKGHQFTWEKSLGKPKWIQAKLDRILVNDSWSDRFKVAEACSIISSRSDHLPILLRVLSSSQERFTQRIKFESLWLEEVACRENITFIHNYVLRRCQNNCIGRLKDANGRWPERGNDLNSLMINYFSNLFQGTLGSLSPVLDNFAKKISHAQNVGLVRSFTIEEIKMALFDMKSEKSLGLDGLLPGFFQHYWDIVARDVLQFCENFRLSKIFGAQCVFVPGRLISDNLLIAYEVQHYLRRKIQGNVGWVGMKLDMSKASDRVNWDLIEGVSEKMGFSSEFVSIVSGLANSLEANVMKSIVLWEFSKASRQSINLGKSSLSSSRNVDNLSREVVAETLGISEGTSQGRYLGLPSLVGRKKTEILGFIKEKGQLEEDKGISWKKCDDLCRPKSIGGMGFLTIRDFNIALLGKQAWRLIQSPESLVSKLFGRVLY